MDQQLGQPPPKTFNHSKKKLPHNPRQNSKILYEQRRRLEQYWRSMKEIHEIDKVKEVRKAFINVEKDKVMIMEELSLIQQLFLTRWL